MSTSGTVLQTVALALPAVALYMTVLVELYKKVEQAQAPMSRNQRPVLRKANPMQSGTEDNYMRGFVTVTRAMNALDLRLALLSLIVLILATILLLVSLLVDYVVIQSVGVLTAVLGFILLGGALAYTVYASVEQLFPEST